MNERERFLMAILAAPDDDGPRLIYSDWLAEHGEVERAQLIQLQCAAALVPAWHREAREATASVEDLLAEHGEHWRAELPVLDGLTWGDFERGFVATVRVPDLPTLYRHAVAIATAAPVDRADIGHLDEITAPFPADSVPWLRRLTLRTEAPSRAGSGRSLLDQIGELELAEIESYDELQWLNDRRRMPGLFRLRASGDNTLGLAFARRLARASWAGGLRHLDLGTDFVDHSTGYYQDPTIGPRGAAALAGATRLRALESLNLDRQRIGDAGLRALLASRGPTGLRDLRLRACEILDVHPFVTAAGEPLSRLDLSENVVGDGGAFDLVCAPRLEKLESLSLDTCEIGSPGLERLTRAPAWQTLCELDVSRNPLRAGGAWAMERAAAPARLHTLRLADCDLDADAGRALGAVPWLRNLLHLDLSRNPLSPDGLPALASLARGALRELSLARTGLDATSTTALGALFQSLRRLDVGENPLGAAGCDALLRVPLPQVLWLRLSACGLAPGQANRTAIPAACPRLLSLDLSNNRLDGAALRRLFAGPPARLRELDVSRCDLDDEGVTALADLPALAGLTVLRVSANRFREPGLVALARSPHLSRTQIEGIEPYQGFWQVSPEGRAELTRRFPREWPSLPRTLPSIFEEDVPF